MYREKSLYNKNPIWGKFSVPDETLRRGLSGFLSAGVFWAQTKNRPFGPCAQKGFNGKLRERELSVL